MADAGSISKNGLNCCVLIGVAAIGGALCSASDEAAKFMGSALGGWCQTGKAALIANVWFGLLVFVWVACRVETCDLQRTAGYSALLANPGAVGSVIEGTWRVKHAMPRIPIGLP